jgi:hypothetical protein
MKNTKHEKNEKVEVYYERLLKLVNSFQHKIIDSFLTIFFIFGLQPYMCVATTSMKRETLHQHKEATLVCEEGIFEVEAIKNLSIPHNNKTILVYKPQNVTKKTRMYCTNCHMTNHNTETCSIKRKEKSILVVFEVTT